MASLRDVAGLMLLLVAIVGPAAVLAASPHGSAGHARAERIAGGLDHPWAVAFLPDGDMLVTEREGRLRRIHAGRLLPEPVAGVPEVAAVNQGGLLDIALHPDFAEQPWIYLSYSRPAAGGQGTAVGRGRWDGSALRDWQLLFKLPKSTRSGHHFGSRMVFDRAGHLYFSIGDRGERPRAQDLRDPAGSILRLRADGGIPPDNPFAPGDQAHPAIFSYGHRNPQGLTLHPASGEIWAHEHGPQGGDELNRIAAGGNYGWPEITYGREYGTGFKIGEGTQRDDVTPPLHYWVPSIAPSGMAFYSGDRFPQWRNSLFIGSLKFRYLARLVVDTQGEVRQEQRLLEGDIGRVRDVRQGPDGYLYLLTDEVDGGLYRISPG